ncbi:MAG: hypothetical protein LH480_00455 [Rubrivivax sp.]|nr:hypothetical protein [Rubrivivax sp.]
MDSQTQDELQHRIHSLTWRSLLAEAEAFHGRPPADAPQRFISPYAINAVRQAIERICDEADSGPELAQYFSHQWLNRFTPRPI